MSKIYSLCGLSRAMEPLSRLLMEVESLSAIYFEVPTGPGRMRTSLALSARNASKALKFMAL